MAILTTEREMKLIVRAWKPESGTRYASTDGPVEMTDTQAVAWLRQLADDIENDMPKSVESQITRGHL